VADDYQPSDEAQGLSNIFRSPDGNKPYCLICKFVVADLDAHCRNIHGESLEVMQRALGGNSPGITLPVPSRGKPRGRLRAADEDERIIPPAPDPIPEIDQAAAALHPGGLEGLRVELLLDESERVFYRSDISEGLALGLTPTHLVISLAYHQVLRRRIQTQVEENRKIAGTPKVTESRTLDMLSGIEDVILKLTRELEKIRENRIVKTDDPRQILEAEMAEAERFVQGHLGELQGRCPGCAAILTLPALPHWAFAPNETRHGTEYMVWSRELWSLVVTRQIPLRVMAYALRTSPEGLMMTARRRGDIWPEWIILEKEEREHREWLDSDDRAATSSEPFPATG
jgi:hypothetical protein